MLSTRAALIFGGSVLSPLLVLLLIQIILAAGEPPTPFLQFEGDVTLGGVPAPDGLEIRVRKDDATGDLAVLTLESIPTTVNGSYGKEQFFRVAGDDPTSGVTKLFFFVVVSGQEVPADMFDVDAAAFVPFVVFEPGFKELNLEVAVPPDLVQNLQILTPPTDNTPTAQFNPPLAPPIAGIKTYQVTTGGAFVDFKDPTLFFTECFDGTGDAIVCTEPIGTGAQTIQITFLNPLADGNYTLGVRVVDQTDLPGGVNEVLFLIDTTPPVASALVAPLDGQGFSTRTITFEWGLSPSPDIESYLLQVVLTGGAFTEAFVVNKVIPHPTTSDEVTFAFDGDFQWRLGARDAVGLEAPEGTLEVRSFSIRTEISEPLLLLPPDGALINDNTPFFDWLKPVTGDPTFYRLQVAVSGGLATPPFELDATITGDGQPPPTEFQTINPLADGPKEWRVLAGDDFGNTTTSDTRTFTLDATPPPAPVILEPADGSSDPDSTPDIIYTQVVDASAITYTLEIGTGVQPPTGDFVNPVLRVEGIPDDAVSSGGQQVIVFTVPVGQRLDPGDYLVHVRAEDAAGNDGAYSGINTFTVLPAVDLFLDAPIGARAGTEFDVPIRVEPRDQPVDLIRAFINFNPADLTVVSITAGTTLELVQTSDSSDVLGTVDYVATTAGPGISGDFVLAVIRFKAGDPAGPDVPPTDIVFNDTDPRKTAAEFLGTPVLGTAFDTAVNILKPTVILPLENAKFSGPGFAGFSRGETVPVTVRLEPNGQKVTASDVHLDFEPRELQVVGVAPGGDTRLDQVILSQFDNTLGTVDFSAFTFGDPARDPAYDFVIVTFETRRATQSLSVGFHQDLPFEFPRKTEASYLGVSVLDQVINFPVEIALGLRLESFVAPFQVQIPIIVRPNGNRVAVVAAFLNFPPGNVEVTSLIRVPTLETLLSSEFDNPAGTLGYAAVTLGTPPLGQFNLAIVEAEMSGDLANAQILFHCYDASGDIIPGCDIFPRRTDAAFGGQSVLDILTPLASLAPQPPDALQNLRRLTPDLDSTPTFAADLPPIFPAAGVKNLNLSIGGSGDVPGPSTIADADVVDVATLTCFDADGVETDCFEGAATVTIELNDALGDGRYSMTLRAVDNLDQDGEEALLDLFTVDTTAPPKPTLQDPADGTFIGTQTPTLSWSRVVDILNDVFYNVQVDDTDNFSSPVLDVQVANLGTGATVELQLQTPLAPSIEYFWRVQSLDDAGAPEVSEVSTEQVEAEAEVGNTRGFTSASSFAVDTTPPTAVTDLTLVTPLSDATPDFTFKRSTDDFGVDKYRVLVSSDIGGPTPNSGDVPDSSCSDLTQLCSFSATSILANGTFTFTVTADDLAGNFSAPAALVFIIDTVLPTVPGEPTLVPGSAITADLGTSIEFVWFESTDIGGSGVDFYNVVINPGGIPGTADFNPGTSDRFRTPFLTDGFYTLTVSAVDVAGNESPIATSDPTVIGRADVAQNLRLVPPFFVTDPRFEWEGPVSGDLRTYEIVIPGVIDVATDFKDPLFEATCPSGDCSVLGTSDTVQLRVIGPVPDGTHRFNVRVENLAGIKGEFVETEFNVDTTPPGPATGLAVDSSETVTADDRTPVLTWGESSGDLLSGLDHYKITLTGQGTGSEVVEIFETDGLETTFTVPDLSALPDDQYTGQVQAVDVAGNESDPATAEFLVDLLPPSVPGLTRTTDDTSRQPDFDIDPPSVDDGSGLDHYDFLIQSTSLIDVTAPAAPVLLFPVDGRIFRDTDPVTVSWNQVIDDTPVTYELQIDTELGAPVQTVADIPDTPGTVSAIAGPFAPGSYKYRVRAIDDGRNNGPFSEERGFTSVVDDTPPEAPTIVLNPGTSDDATPTFGWLRVTDDTDGNPELQIAYDLDIDFEGVGFTTVVSITGIIDEPIFSGGQPVQLFTLPAANALGPGKYDWRVRASDGVANKGAFVLGTTFEVTPDLTAPPLTTLLFPPNKTTGGDSTPEFTFTQVSDDSGVTYRVQVAPGALTSGGVPTGDFSVILFGANVADIPIEFGPDRTLAIQITPDEDDALVPGDFIWRIIVTDGEGNESTSEIFFFRLVPSEEADPPGVPVLQAPADGSVFTSDTANVTFDWSDVVDPSGVRYDLQIIGSGSGTQTTFADLTFSDLQVDLTALPDDDYEWKVRTVNGAGKASDFSASRTFILAATPPAQPTGLAVQRFVGNLGAVQYTPTINWNEAPGVTFFDIFVDGVFKGSADGSVTTFDSDAIDFGVHHIFTLNAFDNLGNNSVASLYFLNAVIDGTLQDPGYTVAADDFLPLGTYTAQVFAVDKLAQDLPGEDIVIITQGIDYKLMHQSEPAELEFAATKLVIALSPTSRTVTRGTATTFTIDSSGLAVDEVDVFITFGTQISVNSITPATGVSLTGLADDDTLFSNADNQINFRANFEARTGAIATISFATPTAGTALVTFDTEDPRKTRSSIGATEIAPSLVNARVVINAPAGGGGPGPDTTPPEAVAGDDDEVDEGDQVVFDGSASTDNAAIDSYAWIPGDGSAPIAGEVVTHVYADNGVFEVNLTVTDTAGNTDSDSMTVTVNNVAPEVDAGPDQSDIPLGTEITLNDPITFTDAGSADTHTANVDWGDDSTDDEVDPAVSPFSLTHTYEDPGEYTVTVTVTDDDGDSGEDTLTIQINDNLPPDADAGDNQPATEGELVTVFGGASSDPEGQDLTFEWNFGDPGSGADNTATGVTATHEYSDDAVFTVTLTVTDTRGDEDTDTLTVTVENADPVVADGPEATVSEGDTIGIRAAFFDPGAGDTHTATIDWGRPQDASPVTDVGQTVSPVEGAHTYEDNGTFTVTVTVTDNAVGDPGVGSNDSREITVNNVAPEVEAGADQAVAAGATVSFSGAFTDPGIDDTHTIEWTFGDPGSPAAVTGTLTPTHVYLNAGEFTVTLTVTDDDGGVGRDILTVNVAGEAPLPNAFAAVAGSLTLDGSSSTSANAGEVVGAEVVIQNTSGADLTGDVQLFRNDVSVHTFVNVAIPGDGEVTLNVGVSAPSSGAFAFVVGNQLAVLNVAPPTLQISGFELVPSAAAAGDTIAATFDTSNIGGDIGTFGIQFIVDGNVTTRNVTLTPGETKPRVEFIEIDDSGAGQSSPGEHIVRLGPGTAIFIGPRSLTYDVAAPVEAEIETEYACDPSDVEARDVNGDRVAASPVCTVGLETGSIVLSVPVQAPAGVQIGSFVDPLSGITVIDRNVAVPIRDPETGEELLSLVGQLANLLEGSEDGQSATAIFRNLSIVTDEQRRDLSTDDPDVGTLGFLIDVALQRLPENARLEFTIKKSLTEGQRINLELVARGDDLVVADEAATVSVSAPGLTTDDLGRIITTMKVSAVWVEKFGVTNVFVSHQDDEGNVEILRTNCTGPDDNNEYTCSATSTSGLSEFSLLALVPVPTNFSAENLAITPAAADPGDEVAITVDISNNGDREGSFSAILKLKRPGSDEFEAIAVESLTLAPGESDTVRFFVIREEQGVYQVDIEGQTGEFQVFRRLDPADLRLSGLQISDTTVEPNEQVTINLFAENVGASDGRTELALSVNDALVQIRSVALEAGERRLVDFRFTAPSEGTFNIAIADVDQQVRPLTGTVVSKEVVVLEPFLAEFSDLQISPLEVDPGDPVTISIVVTNVGEQPGDEDVRLQVDGISLTKTTAVLDPGQEETVTFTIDAPADPDTYTVRIADLTGTFVVEEIDIVVRIESLAVQPDRLAAGETITVSVTLVNESTVEASRSLSLKLDGTEVATRTVTLDVGETSTEQFTVTAPDAPGSHQITIDGLSRSFIVLAPAVLNLVPPLTVSPAEVDPGDTVRVEARLRNDGEVDGQSVVILRINGEVEARTTVRVPAGNTEAVSFEVSRTEPGDYAVEIEAEDAVDVKVLTGSFTVLEEPPPPPPPLSFEGLTVEPTEVESGGSVTISVTAVNDGADAITETVTLRVDGRLIEEKDVTVAGGATQTVSFTHVEEAVGAHTVNVEGLTATFTVTAVEEDGGGGAIIIILIVVIIAVLAIGGGAFFYFRRRGEA